PKPRSLCRGRHYGSVRVWKAALQRFDWIGSWIKKSPRRWSARGFFILLFPLHTESLDVFLHIPSRAFILNGVVVGLPCGLRLRKQARLLVTNGQVEDGVGKRGFKLNGASEIADRL